MDKNIVLKYIRKVSLKKMLLALIPLAISIAIYIILPYGNILDKKVVSTIDQALEAYAEGDEFIVIKPECLYYTGYDMMAKDNHMGAYYYEITGDGRCNFVLLYEATDTVERSYKHSGILVKFSKVDGLFDNMLRLFATDINWVYDDLKAISSDVILMQADREVSVYYVVFILLVIMFGVTVARMITYLMYMVSPVLHPAIRKVKKFKNFDSFEALSMELDEQLTEDVAIAGRMYVTEDYFIHLGSLYVNIVPISEIVFVYKNSQLKNISKMDFMLYYTLHIRGNKKFKCACPGKRKEDADYILDVFAKKNPDIINGYTEENKAEALKRIKEMNKN